MFPEPLPVTILAFDVGASFGWAVLRGEGKHVRIVDHGEGSIWTVAPDVVCAGALAEGAAACVLEQPSLSSGPRIPPSVHFGMGKAGGILERAWRLAYGTRSRDLWIPAMTWRGAIIGGAQRSTEEWKADARKHCDATYGGQATVAIGPLGDWGTEDADAACLGEYAIHSVELVDTIGPQALGKLGWVEAERRGQR